MPSVLYLEDNHTDFELILEFFERIPEEDFGQFKVERAETTNAASRLLAENKYDLILVDYFLPGGDTSALFLKTILDKNTHPPVVLVTGGETVALRTDLLNSITQGLLTLLNKETLSDESLVAVLNQVLSRRLRVLIVDDDESDYELVSEYLGCAQKVRVDTQWVDTLQGAYACLDEAFDAYIVDYSLGLNHGTELIRELVARDIDKPIVLITGHSALEMGSDMIRLIGRRRIRFLAKRNMGTQSLIHALAASDSQSPWSLT